MSNPQKYKIFACDGGGFRGYMTSVILDQLEKDLNARIQAEQPGAVTAPLCDSFDLFAGTSTGSLIAGAFAFGLSAADMKEIYLTSGPAIFPPLSLSKVINRRLAQFFIALLPGGKAPSGDRFPFSSPIFDGSELRKAVTAVFGDNVLGVIKQKNKRLIVTAYDCLNSVPVVFDSDNPVYESVKIVDALMASSAYPGGFPSHVIELSGQQTPLVDGGLVANNPALIALAEYAKYGAAQHAGRVSVAAFGTGSSVLSFNATQSRNMGMLDWTFPIGSPLLDVVYGGYASITDTVSRFLLEAMYPHASTKPFFRFQPYIIEKNSEATASISQYVEDLVFVTTKQKQEFDAGTFQFSSKDSLEAIANLYLEQPQVKERMQNLITALLQQT
jgi:predicted acylesterase/phospholipase RssA